jgi:alpha-glucosidase
MTLPWYHKTTIYQIYPRSFYDSNADGIGDLQGIIQKLDYIHELGFETIWISPFFASPQADFGYDISNYADIAPEYGTMEDALQLVQETHKRGMHIVFDMVMNHTSEEHPWFKESRNSRDNPKADWYIWKGPSLHFGGRLRGMPNNWNSITGGSGWHYAQERGQFYWASFLPFQPDLNYRNPDVKKAMFDIVRFWLGEGVDGFRLDIIDVIYKDSEFRNNQFAFKLIPTEDDPSGFFQDARYTVNQPESFAFAGEFRKVCDEFGEKLSLGEVSGDKEVIRKFLGDNNNNGLTLVFDFEMLNFKFEAEFFRELIEKIEAGFPKPFMPVYVFSNHDRRRSIKRIGNDIRKAKLLHMLQFTVRGVPCMYYGEEIGMTDLPLPFSTALDPIPRKFRFLPRFIFDSIGLTINRDEVRTPMQWDGSRNAGFSSARKTWLPVHENYTRINVGSQSEDDSSLLNTIQNLSKIRREEPCLQEGSLKLLKGLPGEVLGYTRTFGTEKVSVYLNFGERVVILPSQLNGCIFRLTEADRVENASLQLGKFGGVILKSEGDAP